MNSKENTSNPYIAWTALLYGSVISLASAIVMVPISLISVLFFDSSLLIFGVLSIIATVVFILSFVLYEDRAFPHQRIVARAVAEIPKDPHENDILYPRQPRIFH